jgi:cell wall-associated protease
MDFIMMFFGWNFVADENGTTIDTLLPEFIRSKMLIASNQPFAPDFIQTVEREFALQKQYFEFALSSSNEPDIQNQFQKIFVHPKADPAIAHGNNDVKGNLDNHGTMMASIMTRLLSRLPISYHKFIKILPVRVLPSEGDERDEDLAAGIKYAAMRGANIISMSFGKNISPKETLVQDAISYAQKKGVLFIHSSGNEGKNIDLQPQYPRPINLNSDWIQVGATSFHINDHFIQMYSNYGLNNVDIFSPGEFILGQQSHGKLVPNYGTSAATAIVAITAAALWATSECHNSKTVRQYIQSGVTVFPSLEVFPPTPLMQPLAQKKVNFCTLSKSCGVLNPIAALRKSMDRSSCQFSTQ